jgi:sterol desaturase/sphingolipid hydroxylase (fatty acid hydroxylase superfamily)
MIGRIAYDVTTGSYRGTRRAFRHSRIIAGDALVGLIVAAGFVIIGPLVMILSDSHGAQLGGVIIWALVLIVLAYGTGDELATRRMHRFYAEQGQHRQGAVL